MNKYFNAYSITIGELAELGSNRIPEAFIPACHLIYSSPATLSYNSPGAIGFGVKRAALTIPESIMLLVSPSACGRNSTIMSIEEGYADKMFYLLMDETDLVTGRHLKKISEAIKKAVETACPKPKSVIICLTCVDALLGTDLERVCRNSEKETGVKVIPSYMYALEREGRKPPMTAIRETIYSLVERKQIDPNTINLLGYFSPVNEKSDLHVLLKKAGIKNIQEVSKMETMDEYEELGKANFNLVLDPESNYAAESMKKRLGIPYIEFHRLYDPEKIHRQYQLFAHAVGIEIDDYELYNDTLKKWKKFGKEHKGLTISIGEMTNGNPYEMAAAFSNNGIKVDSIFSNLTEDDFPFVEKLAKISPETKVFTGTEPSMLHYRDTKITDLSIGKDAAIYCPSSKHVEWFREEQPFGYQAVNDLIDEMEEALS